MTIKKLGLIVGGILLLAVVGTYFGPEHQRFLKFSDDRDTWHRQCDAYVNVKPTPANAVTVADCTRRLNELTAYAAQQGW